MSIILKTTNLCKSFSRQTVVNNISLNIEKNSVYGLLGPNGAGKSTTLKMITGILKPTSGSIEFDGHAWRRKDFQYSTSKNFSKAKTVKIAGAGKRSTTIKKLTSKKTYYVRIRAYKIVNKKTVYGAWSVSKKVVVK